VSDLSVLRRLLRDEPVARVATVAGDGGPHVAPLWFVWMEDAIYVSTRIGGGTWANVVRDARIAVAIDRGRDWTELVGAVAEGKAATLSPQDPLMRAPMSAWHEKYRGFLGGGGFEKFAERVPDLGFLRIEPESVRFWDHGA